MFVATGVGAVIGRLPGRCCTRVTRRLRLRRGRPEEQQAQDEDGGGGAAWTGVPQGGTAKKEHGKGAQSACEGRKRLGGLGSGGRASFARRPRPGGDDGRQLGRGGRIQAIISAPCITKMGGGVVQRIVLESSAESTALPGISQPDDTVKSSIVRKPP